MNKKRTTVLVACVFVITLLAVTVLSAFTSKGTASPALADDNTCQFFPETGFKVCGRFLEYFKANGGVAQQGFPISIVFDELNAPPPAGDGQTHKVQYFQRARFEEHPENQPPNDVQLGLLGTEQYRSKYGEQTVMVVRSIKTQNKINDHTAKDGNTYVIVDLLITNTTAQAMTVSPASITLRTTAIYDYKVSDATYSLDKYLKLSTLNPKENVGGVLAYEVPTTEVPKSITIDYFFGKDTVAL